MVFIFGAYRMTELIKIEQHDGIQTVSARDLWEGLESKREFASWIKDRVDGFIENVDYVRFDSFVKGAENGTGNKTLKEYSLTLDMAKHLAMLERNVKGLAIRQYFIEVEKKARALPTGTELMALALIEASKFLEAKEKRIAELEPKAAFFDQVADSKTALQMRDVAAVLNIPRWGRNRIFDMLREKSVLDARNIPYRQYQDNGYFRVVEQSWTDDKGDTHVSLKTLVYQKGLAYIKKLIEKVAV
jgi:anti-repressor protein